MLSLLSYTFRSTLSVAKLTRKTLSSNSRIRLASRAVLPACSICGDRMSGGTSACLCVDTVIFKHFSCEELGTTPLGRSQEKSSSRESRRITQGRTQEHIFMVRVRNNFFRKKIRKKHLCKRFRKQNPFLFSYFYFQDL